MISLRHLLPFFGVVLLKCVASEPVLGGYDVVSYFDLTKDNPDAYDEGLSVEGEQRYSYQWEYGDCGMRAEFWFSSEDNKQRFIDDPWRYAPKYGGFCAWGIAREYESEGWPWDYDHLGPPGGPEDGWVIVDGSLYVNYHASVTDLFLGARGFSVEENIEVADRRWREWYGSLEDGPMNIECVNNPGCKHDAQTTSRSVLECFEEKQLAASSSPSPSSESGGNNNNDDESSNSGDGGDGGDGSDGGGSSGGCNSEPGEYDDKRLLTRTTTDNAEECCDECSDTDGCERWQWWDSQQGCYLLESGSPATVVGRSRWTRGVRKASTDTASSVSSDDDDDDGCSDEQWRCDDGECIARNYKCDNYLDCDDESDESEQYCGGSSESSESGGGEGGPASSGDCSYELLNNQFGEFYMDVDVSNDRSEVHFTLTVKIDDLDSWIGIGFSDDGTMWSKFNSGIPGSDAVIREGNDVVEYNIESYSEADILKETNNKQDLTDTSVTKQNGYVIIEFTKPVESPSNSDDDLSFFDAQFIIWGFGLPGDEEIGYHANRGTIAIALGECLPGCSLQLECDDNVLLEDDNEVGRRSTGFRTSMSQSGGEGERSGQQMRGDHINERMGSIEQRFDEIDDRLDAIQAGIDLLLREGKE